MNGAGSTWASALRLLMIDLGLTACRSGECVCTRVAFDTYEMGETANDGMPVGERYYK